MKYTEAQLKRALVEALPEKLTVFVGTGGFGVCGRTYFLWKGERGSNRSILNTEWPAIVGMVEDKCFLSDRRIRTMDEDEFFQYQLRLVELAPLGQSSCAKWQTRAEAFADIGAIEVKEESK